MHLKFYRPVILFFAALLFTFSAIQCSNDSAVSEDHPKKDDSAAVAKKDSLRRDSVEKVTVKFQTLIFPKKKKLRDSVMAVFNKNYSSEQQYIILALNRLDIKNKWRADTLSIPDKFDHTLMLYSPFPPQIPALAKVNKIVFFSYPIQAYALYEHGKIVKWGPTSMGKKAAQTKRGLMFANWKKELAISTVDSDWKLPYNFNIHNTLGIGWHEYDLPGYPASHSCLRLLREDAKYLYNWADQWVLTDGGDTVKVKGTPVIVFGDYGWGQQKPWKHLQKNSNLMDITVKQLENIIAPHYEAIINAQKTREQLVD